MADVTVRKRIAAPRATVWAAYTDHVSWSEWAGIGRVRLAREGDPPPNGKGCVRVISSAGISVHEEILTFEPPVRMTYRVLRGGLPIRDHFGEVRFDDQGDATDVTWHCRFDSRIPGLAFVWKAVITVVFRRALDGLSRSRLGVEGRRHAA